MVSEDIQSQTERQSSLVKMKEKQTPKRSRQMQESILKNAIRPYGSIEDQKQRSLINQTTNEHTVELLSSVTPIKHI